MINELIEQMAESANTFNILHGWELILASASPRRRELIENLHLKCEITEARKIDESYPGNMRPEEVPAYLSRKKAHAYLSSLKYNQILLTADTVVINRGEVVGKPRDLNDAAAMLRRLSGHTHKVVTGVTLATLRSQSTFTEETDVEFANLSDREIAYYVENFRPLDKAGAYGIQEWIGYIAVCGIRGDFYNVMGLPLRSVYENLIKITTRPPVKTPMSEG